MKIILPLVVWIWLHTTTVSTFVALPSLSYIITRTEQVGIVVKVATSYSLSNVPKELFRLEETKLQVGQETWL